MAMNGKKQSGYAENSLKAFRPLSASFVGPSFALEGDTFRPLGKIMNYTADTAALSRSFILNGKSLLQSVLSVKNAHIDTLSVQAESTDSLRFKYLIQKRSGYTDGEERVIPVFKTGVVETKGYFNAMESDSVLSFSFDKALGKVSFRAEASVLPVLLDETERLRNYEYLCHEQIASKIKGLLVQKRIKAILKEPFEHDQLVKKLIKKLDEGRRDDGTWGWWKDSPAELWISLHALESYMEAEKAGYKVSMNKQAVIDYLVYQLSDYNGMNKLDALSLLNKLDAKVDYRTSLERYESETASKHTSLYEKLRLLQLKQAAGLPVGLDFLLPYKHSTMFGNLYFGENKQHFFDNSIQNTLLAYKILRREGKHADWLQKMRNYFLEQRKDGYWRNTYESALILETILPDLLNETEKPKPSALTITATNKITGTNKELIDRFPYTTTFDGDSEIQLAKQGDFPVYITAYQQYHNSTPAKVSKEFWVYTWFERKTGGKVETLKGGEEVVLKAEVTVAAEADYVMVEIPIPAGCGYEDKEQKWWGPEEHREYFKNKVSIFCRKLKPGKHTFSIKLMPRYSGSYTLNPAKAEMMYFPVFFGREAMRKVAIE